MHHAAATDGVCLHGDDSSEQSICRFTALGMTQACRPNLDVTEGWHAIECQVMTWPCQGD